MKILFVGHTCPKNGGSVTLARDLLAGLCDLGHEIQALSYLSPKDEAKRHFPQHAYPAKIRIRHFVSEYVPFDSVPQQSQIDEVRGALRVHLQELEREFLPDLVLFSNAFAWFAELFISKYPTVQLVYGSPFQHLGSATYPGNFQSKLVQVMKQCNMNVAVSEYVKDKMIALGVENVTVIEPGLDRDFYLPREEETELINRHSLHGKFPIIGNISPYRSIKHPMDLVGVASYFVEKNIEGHFVLLGDGPLRAEMDFLVREKSLSNRFTFIKEWLPIKDIASYLNLFDIVFFPSTVETFGKVIREAQALGKVVIARNLPPMNQLIKNKIDGIALSDWTIPSLARCITELGKESSIRMRISQEAPHSGRRLRNEQMVAMYDSLIKKIVRC